MSTGFNHDFYVELFRQRPLLARELLRRCAGRAISGEYAELASIDLSQVVPIEYRADAVVILRDDSGNATHAIVVEVQLASDPRKRFTWPVYVTVARANLECPVTLLVVAPESAVARWVESPIYIGGGFTFTPCVLSLEDMPESLDDETAHAFPELAVLAALAHPSLEIVEKALREIRGLSEDQRKLYLDELALVLPPSLRSLAMDMKNYQYRSDFARQYVAQGREEGRQEGRGEMLLEVLVLKFGPMPSAIEDRLKALDALQQRRLLQRSLSTGSLDELLAELDEG